MATRKPLGHLISSSVPPYPAVRKLCRNAKIRLSGKGERRSGASPPSDAPSRHSLPVGRSIRGKSYGKITWTIGGSLLNCPRTILSIFRWFISRILYAMLFAFATPFGISTLLRKATALAEGGAPL